MIYSAASIANAFLSKAFESNEKISPMKIQKLAYLAQGYSLVELNRSLIDELFEAWKFGPVLPSLYAECKKYGSGSITNYLSDYDYQSLSQVPAPIPTDDSVIKIINFVWKNYGFMDAISLSDWTHEKNGPWDKARHKNGITYRNAPIDNNEIKLYFIEKMDKNDDETS